MVRNQAMFADTIAEYYVEDDHLRLELEIGSNDVAAFRNLLPDALYQRLGYENTPLKERLPRFVSADMPVLVGRSKLPGQVTKIGPATRPLRDAITGEELPTPEDEATVVIRATIIFSFDERPDSLTLVAPKRNGCSQYWFRPVSQRRCSKRLSLSRFRANGQPGLGGRLVLSVSRSGHAAPVLFPHDRLHIRRAV